MHGPKGILNQQLFGFVYHHHIAVGIQIGVNRKDGQHFGPIACPSVTVLVVIFYGGFTALRVGSYDLVDGFTKVGIGFRNDFRNADAVWVAGFISKQNAHRGADHRRSSADDHSQQQHHAAGTEQGQQRCSCLPGCTSKQHPDGTHQVAKQGLQSGGSCLLG